MKTFAGMMALAVAANALKIGQVDEVDYDDWIEAAEYNAEQGVDETISIPQGDGQDHLLWSWDDMLEEQEQEVQDALEEIVEWDWAIIDGQDEVDEAMEDVDSEAAIAFKQCELIRHEEQNLFYQCTQNAINNYALNHYGGEERSFESWLEDVIYCNSKIDGLGDCASILAEWYPYSTSSESEEEELAEEDEKA